MRQKTQADFFHDAENQYFQLQQAIWHACGLMPGSDGKRCTNVLTGAEIRYLSNNASTNSARSIYKHALKAIGE